ncbi:MAG: hypothetical protein ACKVHE_19355 [Planctomycetales bacterium]|jgi:hypothetical protein
MNREKIDNAFRSAVSKALAPPKRVTKDTNVRLTHSDEFVAKSALLGNDASFRTKKGGRSSITKQ